MKYRYLNNDYGRSCVISVNKDVITEKKVLKKSDFLLGIVTFLPVTVHQDKISSNDISLNLFTMNIIHGWRDLVVNIFMLDND